MMKKWKKCVTAGCSREGVFISGYCADRYCWTCLRKAMDGENPFEHGWFRDEDDDELVSVLVKVHVGEE